jgi:hypothetical protein
MPSGVYWPARAAIPAADWTGDDVKKVASLAGVIAGVALTAGLAAGCGSGPSGSGLPAVSGTGPATAASTATPSAVAYTQCMRNHGVNMADPDPSTGTPKLGASVDPGDPSVKAALSACKSLLPPGTRTGSSPADMTMYLAYAKCMRSNGLPGFPDPQPGPNGIFPNSGVDRNSAAFQKASAACQHVLDTDK